MSDLKRFIETNARRGVDVDVEKRIVRGAVFATSGLASDGWIILPEGMALERFRRAPLVLARHLTGGEQGTRSLVVGNALSMTASATELTAEVQFADTADGRDYAWLYGCNQERQPFMRAWSVEGPILERGTASWAEARKLTGEYWDETAAELLRRTLTTVAVAVRFELTAVAAVAAGADRNALTRAFDAGNATAGAILSKMDLDAAREELAAFKARWEDADKRIARLEADLQALRGEGASAAARGDSEAICAELRSLTALLKQRQ
jgi:hypothetical protein